MSIKQMVGAVTGAVGSTIINGGQSLDTGFQLLNGGLGYALDEMKMMKAEQKIDHLKAEANLIKEAALARMEAKTILTDAGVTDAEIAEIKAFMYS